MTTRIIHRAPVPAGQAARLWFGILAGPVAWFALLALEWAVVEFGCRLGLQRYTIFNIDALRVIPTVLAALAALITVAGLLLALSTRSRLGQEPDDGQDGQWHRHRFMAAAGIYLNILFIVVIILTFIPVVALPSCTGPGGA